MILMLNFIIWLTNQIPLATVVSTQMARNRNQSEHEKQNETWASVCFGQAATRKDSGTDWTNHGCQQATESSLAKQQLGKTIALHTEQQNDDDSRESAIAW